MSASVNEALSTVNGVRLETPNRYPAALDVTHVPCSESSSVGVNTTPGAYRQSTGL